MGVWQALGIGEGPARWSRAGSDTLILRASLLTIGFFATATRIIATLPQEPLPNATIKYIAGPLTREVREGGPGRAYLGEIDDWYLVVGCLLVGPALLGVGIVLDAHATKDSFYFQ